MIEWVSDAGGRRVFRVTVADPGKHADYWFAATVDTVVAWDDDDTMTPAGFQPYLRCDIKWDSCAHFRFGEPRPDNPHERAGYLHFCSVQDFKNHASLMEALYRLAFRRMGREPEPGEEW